MHSIRFLDRIFVSFNIDLAIPTLSQLYIYIYIYVYFWKGKTIYSYDVIRLKSITT